MVDCGVGCTLIPGWEWIGLQKRNCSAEADCRKTFGRSLSFRSLLETTSGAVFNGSNDKNEWSSDDLYSFP